MIFGSLIKDNVKTTEFTCVDLSPIQYLGKKIQPFCHWNSVKDREHHDTCHHSFGHLSKTTKRETLSDRTMLTKLKGSSSYF